MIRKSSSVILGHYFYASSLSKWQQFFRKRGNSYEQRYKKGLPPLNDFSEFDLWWLLDRKKREKAPHGNLHFYVPSYGNEAKLMMLETYGNQTECLGFRLPCIDYMSFYEEAICDIVFSIRIIRKSKVGRQGILAGLSVTSGRYAAQRHSFTRA